MPIIGVLIGGIDFSSLSITVGEAKITYGSFIQNVIDFLIIALFVFIIVKFFEKFSKKEEEEAEEKEDEKVVLLREIRDALKKDEEWIFKFKKIISEGYYFTYDFFYCFF